jgi:sigma-B regulation protein RsbU (phosphoserine phosphatase)
MAQAWRQYTVLILVLAAVAAYQTGNLTHLFLQMRHPELFPSQPFPLQIGTRTISGGPLQGDQILSLNGKSFTSERQYDDAVYGGHPGDTLRLLLSEPSGRAVEKTVVIPNQVAKYTSVASIGLTICVNVFIPLVCIVLGFTVAFIRPRDLNAWFLLLLLLAFSNLVGDSDWRGASLNVHVIWDAFGDATWGMWMMLFGIYFPTRYPLDRRRPWLKYLILIPLVAIELIYYATIWIWLRDINLALLIRHALFTKVYFLHTVFQILGVSVFFAVLGAKGATEASPDDRRRLKILRMGASIALGPMLLVVLYALVRDRDLFVGLPWFLEVGALCMMAIFPATLAYVIVVERAMDLSFVVRQSVKYGLARGGLWVLRASLIGCAIYIFTNPRFGRSFRPELLAFAIAGLVVVRRKNTDRASAWLDKKFFREEYDAEQLLTELAGEVGRYVEIDPLLETVARRLSNTLHVSDIVILIREGDLYRTRFSTRLGEPMDIAVGSRLLTESGANDSPLQIYFDKPQPWIRSLNAQELQTLDFMRSEVLLALRGRGSEEGRIVGIMSLGPKKSEQPYSTTDLRLLQTIAIQMGMAIQNSRMASSLADAAASRESMNRELEIAREVQERLFPQKFPAIAGLDCWGYCRPARGVGGDYYDFIELSNGKVGLAIGDVSGKGIAAALLMASLQASLRGQTMAGVHDLAELMGNVNKLVYNASQTNKYATFFYGEFDPEKRQLFFVNAGHNPPLILRGREVILLETGGPVVGLLPGAKYTMDVCGLQPGDIFVGYTDGLNEAMNEQNQEWDDERFVAAARHCSSGTAKEMIDGVFRSADAFTGSAKQHDDMTLLVMKLAA